jgi:polysaccharide biosynthesis transport protein
MVNGTNTALGHNDIDLREIFGAVRHKRKRIIGMTLLAFLASLAFVNFVSPKFTSESRLLLENQDNYFARPDKDQRLSAALIDPEDVLSQVQLAQSQSVSRAVIKKLNLSSVSEFDPISKGVPFYLRPLIMLGLMRDPTTVAPEDRVLETYLSKVSIFQIGKSRVLSAEVTSKDPQLAAKIANTVTEQYIEQQTSAKKQTMKNGSAWLVDNIEPLRQKVIEADAKVEAFRSKSNLFFGTNNNTITNQQLSELNTQLSTARATQADQQSRAKMIRQALQSGRIFDFSEILKDDLIRKLSENRSNLRALLASEERIFLPQHPRIKELTAQIADLEGQIRAASERTARALENDARAASARVVGILADIEEQKKLSAQANGDDVQLKALEREAKSLREQFDSYSAKVNDAAARDLRSPTTADARIVTVALAPSAPSFPKVLPIIAISTLGTLFVTTLLTIAGQLLKTTVQRPAPLDRPVGTFESAVSEAQINSDKKSASEPLSSGSTLLNENFTELLPVNSMPVMSSIIAENPAKIVSTAPVTLESIPTDKAVQDERNIAQQPNSVSQKLSTPLQAVASALHEPQPKYPKISYAQNVDTLVESCKSFARNGTVTVLMSGSAPHLGLTGSAISLARKLSLQGRTIILDLNEHNPDLDQLIEQPEPDGITDTFAGEVTVGDAIHRDNGSKAHVMPFGFSDINTASADDLHDLVDVLQQTYDFVVLDTGVLGGLESMLAPQSSMSIIVAPAYDEDSKIRALCNNIISMGAQSVTVLHSSQK